MTIFSHSVIAGSSSIARTRFRRLFAALAVAISHLFATHNLAQPVRNQYMTSLIAAKLDRLSFFDTDEVSCKPYNPRQPDGDARESGPNRQRRISSQPGADEPPDGRARRS